MEDLTIIRIKRSLESAPVENINLTSKRFKLDSGKSLPVIATLKSKDESLETILQTAVTKFKQEKQANRQKLHAWSHQELYKQKSTKQKKGTSSSSAKTAALDRYQIVNKVRGITPLDAEAESYLLKTDRLSLNLPDGAKKLDEANFSEAGDAATHLSGDAITAAKGDGARMIPLQFLDVDHCSVKELNKKQVDVICMNGIPLEQSYVYDIFITRVPKGYSTDEFLISDVINDQLVDDTSPEDGDLGSESDDSNAENNYRNDYPDAEESDMNESEGEGSEYFLSDTEGVTGTSQYWGDNVVDQMAHCSLDNDGDSDASEPSGEPGEWRGGGDGSSEGDPYPDPPGSGSLLRLASGGLGMHKNRDWITVPGIWFKALSNDDEKEGKGDVLAGEKIPPQYKSLFRLSKAVLSKIKQNEHDSDREEAVSDDCSDAEVDDW